MAIECASCFCSISRHDDQIECSSCDKKFHISCKGVTVKLLTDMKLQATIKQWSCGCARAGGAAAAIDGGAANAREFPDFKHQLKELGEALHGSFSGLLRVAVNELLKENASLREDIRTCQQQNASLTASLESGIGSLREGMVELRADNARLRDELAACRGAPADEQTAKQDNGDHFRGRTSAMTTKSARGRNNNKQITADNTNMHVDKVDDRRRINAPHVVLSKDMQPQEHAAERTVARGAVGMEVGAKVCEAGGDWNEVVGRKVRRRRLNETIRGAATWDDDNFSFAKQRVWFYVGGAKPTSTPEDVMKYLKKRFVSNEFVIEKLSRENMRTAAFKVGAVLALLGELNRPDTWPAGTMVRRFNFFRPRGGHQDGEKGDDSFQRG